jgi:hypothetical protein
MAAFWILSLSIVAAVFIVALALWIRHRNQQMEHQERLAALEKGAVLPVRSAEAPWSPRVYLLRGLIWTFTGAALTLALLGAALSDHRHYRESPEWLSMRAKNVSQNLEIPIEQARQIVEKDAAERAAQETGAPPAIALFGLIPLGVGLAYLVFYRVDAARDAQLPEAGPGPFAPRS